MDEEGVKLPLAPQSQPVVQPKRKGKLRLILIILVIILILAGILYLLFTLAVPYKGCESWECFNENLEKCSKAKFAGGKDIVFGYTIQGEKENTCEIEVEFLQGNIASRSAKELEYQKMTCYTPLNVIMLPESDLANCHGELKEKLQEQIISQLHNYIIQNLGEINKALLNPLIQEIQEK